MSPLTADIVLRLFELVCVKWRHVVHLLLQSLVHISMKFDLE